MSRDVLAVVDQWIQLPEEYICRHPFLMHLFYTALCFSNSGLPAFLGKFEIKKYERNIVLACPMS